MPKNLGWIALLLVGCSGTSIDVGPGGSSAQCSGPLRAEVGYPLDANAPPATIAIGDMDGDGDPDLVAGNYYGAYPTISVLLNQGVGTFAPRVNYSTAMNNPWAVVLADFDEDGKLDVAASTQNGGVSVLLNAGDGTLRAAQRYETPGVEAGALAVGDLDGDHHLDLVVAGNPGTSDASIALLKNAGDGSFSSSEILLPAPAPVASGLPSMWQEDSVATADFDADGDTDIVVAAQGFGLNSPLALLLNQGDGTFVGTSYSLPTSFQGGRAASAADLDGDGDIDVVLDGMGQIGVLLNAGDGTLGSLVSYAVSDTLDETSVAIADVDGDSFVDLVVADDKNSVGLYRDDALVIFHNEHDGTFSVSSRLSAALPNAAPNHANGPWAIATADLNGDGRPDFAVANQVIGSAGVFLSCP